MEVFFSSFPCLQCVVQERFRGQQWFLAIGQVSNCLMWPVDHWSSEMKKINVWNERKKNWCFSSFDSLFDQISSFEFLFHWIIFFLQLCDFYLNKLRWVECKHMPLCESISKKNSSVCTIICSRYIHFILSFYIYSTQNSLGTIVSYQITCLETVIKLQCLVWVSTLVHMKYDFFFCIKVVVMEERLLS